MLLGPKTHAFLSGVQITYYMYIGIPGGDKKWPFKKEYEELLYSMNMSCSDMRPGDFSVPKLFRSSASEGFKVGPRWVCTS